MNRKISMGMAIGLIVIAAAISAAIAMNAVKLEYNSILKGLPEKMERYAVLDELDDIINENYYGKSDSEKLEEALAGGYVSGLGDATDVYMTAEQYKEYLSEKNGNMSGIGIEYERSKNKIKITEVYDDSPAENAGLKKGDIIVAFDGIRLNKSNYNELSAKLLGDTLTSVNIIYKRDKAENNVTVVKGYEASSVITKVYENVGYMKITDFFSSTPEQVKSAVDRFVSSGMKAIVVDLRKNESGNYDYMMNALDVFVPMSDDDKAAASVIDENGQVTETFTTTPGEVNIPVGILASSETKGAAELFCCNMRDFGKGLIFSDSNTAGITQVQEVFELSSGSAVLLTTGKILPYKSDSFEDDGLVPDYVLEAQDSTNNLQNDSQFIYAVSVLTQ